MPSLFLNTPIDIPQLPGLDVLFYPDFIAKDKADELLAVLLDSLHWRQDKITIFGREVDQPRLTAWYGDAGKSYTYSGLTMYPEPWTRELAWIKQQIETKTNSRFNSVLVNLYRNGQDSMGWHSDDEPELGSNPTIASVSLGQERVFQLKHRFDKALQKVSIPLNSGSLLLMKGATQHYWKHQVPKSTQPMDVRVNLTFRWIV